LEIKYQLYAHESHSSIVGIMTGYGLDNRGVRVRVPVGSRTFTSPYHPDQLWGPPNLQTNGYGGAISPGVKQQNREADHSPPTSVKVKETWIDLYIHSPYAFKA
jgi:hypothetical protein